MAIEQRERPMLDLNDDDYLGPTGEKIVADRYLLKDIRKEALAPGALVVAVLDKKRAYHELARVKAVDRDADQVTVELRDGSIVDLPVSQVDVLLETSPRQMWRRVARGAAAVTRQPEVWEEAFYELQKGWRYVPGGRINASLGTGMQVTSYNCFVIPNVGPDLRDYAESFGQTLEIQARSGGVGMNLSRIPPQGTLIPVSTASRKAELMLVLDAWHPDLVDFLETEYPHSTKLVRADAAFWRAVEEDDEWVFRFPDTSVEGYDEKWAGDLDAWLRQGLPVEEHGRIRARELMEKILASDAHLVPQAVGFCLSPGDSRSTIARTLGDMWEAMRDGKRVSLVLSSLRPRYSYVRGVNGRSSGAYSWGLLYDKGNQVFGEGFGPVGVGEIMSVGCQLTLQGGSRRGALMLILNDRHADLPKFIRAKQVDGVITGANISVGVSEEFMQAKRRGESWQLGFVPPSHREAFDGDFGRWLEEGKPFEVTETISAAKLWRDICESAWKSAEPGVVFLGRANAMSNSWYFNPLVATNPCGEQPLPPYGICNLGAVVLARFANGFRDSGVRTEFSDPEREAYVRSLLLEKFPADEAEFLLHHIRWEELELTTRRGIRFQDAVIDATYYPFEENRQNQMSERRVGLGIMGLHDLMLYCGIRYGSEESVKLIDVLMGLMAEWAYLESVELAKEYGPFPKFDAEKFLQSGFMRHMAAERPHVVEAIRKHGVRNVTTMTIAPTGTTGTMVGCSTGCEPYYAWSYFRNSRLGLFEEHAAIVEQYRREHPSEESLPPYFVTAMELTPEEHVRVQAALQRWIDSSISKTCNAPHSYTVEDTVKLYDLAYELGCKGITIYRDGSRSEQVLSLKKDDQAGDGEGAKDTAASAPVEKSAQPAQVAPGGYVKRRRPDVLYGATYRKETPLGKAFITINDDPDTHMATEVFVNVGKAGSDVYAANEALGRAITLYLRESNNPNREAELVKHFSGIGGQNAVGFGAQRITSVPDAIAKALIEHAETFPLRHMAARQAATSAPDEGDGAKPSELRAYSIAKDWCPECHQHTLIRQGGCYECEACGYSKC
ncbi:adenosylcobalamin-dependent ribonucleoside-diphosphate reductase [Alicyclobacillus acidocaldarius]|uniref:Vitamin B12-dependent ribonucleotide reductase n=1 Tax=Alicyclobacillus acidocaldarius subsp. acidocaldarius (strain ATCC 27009 / DSM 446 / BCRC 14685 / JCM 5260 / KCTC 1825 / NBRC 15652 / NCIMB 11725 / NRRL B-14509 / 104-IA) TaxID=521098 RepID=C8WXT6_ALIAD|nr:adenosylcobalamin-dependent ribonucleoside-diphosphate reductase [Alicyclobacillus acidocaldarius]ACV58898.1 ribonucleoside-diphosphate reductase, adenosylcobalamin-dependent [Alicyclobacillus acidocaldarius subsp. acidocaldarius DSM 446]